MLLSVIVTWSWHEGIGGLLLLSLLATADAEVYQHLGTLIDAADDLGQHTVGDACLHLVSLEGVTLHGPHLQRSLYILYLLTLLQQGLVGHEAQRLGGYCQHVVLLQRIDGDVRCQSGLQLQVLVGC